MKKLFLILCMLFFSVEALAQVPYYKTRYEAGKECRYFYSGVSKGFEQLVNVQCFDDKR